MPQKIKHIITVLLVGCLLFLYSEVEGQYNLVPNYSFETYTTCPVLGDDAPPSPWYLPTNSSGQAATYFNACSTDPCTSVPYNCINSMSYQPARTGQAYDGVVFLGLFTNSYRTYLQTKLNDSLRIGKCYYIEFFVSHCNTTKYACNNISLLLTQLPKYVDTLNDPLGVIPANAQIQNYGNPIISDTMNWVKVSGVYTALGGEQYITIGNFKYDNQTSKITINPSNVGIYFDVEHYIEDVSVIPLDSMPLKADAGRDTTIKLGDSVFIGSLTNGLTGVVWYDANNAVITSAVGVPGFYVKPPLSTFYVIEQTVCGYYSRDTVWVNVNPLPVKLTSYEASPQPLSFREGQNRWAVLNKWTTATEINVSHFNVQRSVNGKDFTTIGKVAANNKPSEYRFTDDRLPFTEGEATLYYRLEVVDRDGSKTYSTIQHVNLSNHQGLSISPNPAREFVTVYCSSMKEIRVIDNLGRVIIWQIPRQEPRDDMQVLGIQQLRKGLYLVQVITGNGEMKTGKLIVSD